MIKGIKFIIACILSLTIIYVGAGANLTHSCCARNKLARSGTMDKNSYDKLYEKAGHRDCCMQNFMMKSGKCSLHHKTDCCRPLIYKVDLQKSSSDTALNVPVYIFLPNHILLVCNDLQREFLKAESYSDPPYPSSSRFYLNLYSTLLI